MKIRLTSFFFFASICLAPGQPPAPDHDAIYRAEIIYRSKKDLETAIPWYRTAFDGPFTDVSKIFQALDCATQTGDTLAAVQFMEKGLELGLTPEDYRRNWSRIGNSMPLESVATKCDSLTPLRTYRQQLNPELIAQLQRMSDRDQEFRSEEPENWELQRQNDSLNWQELQSIVGRLGRLPSYAELGLEGYDNLELLFYHMDREPLASFLPYVLEGIAQGGSNLAHVILYQLDRIGMSEGRIYTIDREGKIEDLGARTILKNGYPCQTFGEWFHERSPLDGKTYRTPLDPNLDTKEVDRVRRLFGLDDMDSKKKREPWVLNVPAEEFEEKIQG